MRRDQRRQWCLLLSAIVSHVLHASAGQTQELGSSSCIAESAQTGGNGQGCRAERVQAGGNGGSIVSDDPKVALGTSMLQVHSKSQLQKPEATRRVLEAKATKIVSSGSGTALKYFVEAMHIHSDHLQNLLQGNGTTLESFVEMTRIHSKHVPIFLLMLVITLLLLLCCFMLLASGDREPSEIPWNRMESYSISHSMVGQEGKAGSPGRRSLPSASPSAFCSPVPSAQELMTGVSPASVNQILSQQSLPVVASRHLCPGLVVPNGNECMLAVPLMPMASSTSQDMAILNVQDLEGKPVIQAEVVVPHSGRAHDTQRPLAKLRGCVGAPLLAYCMAGHGSGSRQIAYLYNGRNELFAEMSKVNTNWYVLKRTTDGAQLFFEGDIVNHAVTVTNEQSLVVSETSSSLMSFNPGGSYYKLRVAAKVDVGLILCALFSMNFLERS